MEDKKLNELNDEALDAVVGGAFVKYNEETGKYDVYRGNSGGINSFYLSYDTEKAAKEAAIRLSKTEKRQYRIPTI